MNVKETDLHTTGRMNKKRLFSEEHEGVKNAILTELSNDTHQNTVDHFPIFERNAYCKQSDWIWTEMKNLNVEPILIWHPEILSMRHQKKVFLKTLKYPWAYKVL